MNVHQQALQWAKQYLIEQRQSSILSDTKIVETAYSLVHKIETTKQTVYLKQVPEALFLEPGTLLFLHQQRCNNIPEILAVHPTLRCFIMSACGNISLRYSFKELIHFDQLALGIEHYTTIQRAFENKSLLLSWMKDNTAGYHRIRAGVPLGWAVADKTGSGSYGIANDMGMAWSPACKPVVSSIFTVSEEPNAKPNDAVIAKITQILFEEFEQHHACYKATRLTS